MARRTHRSCVELFRFARRSGRPGFLRFQAQLDCGSSRKLVATGLAVTLVERSFHSWIRAAVRLEAVNGVAGWVFGSQWVSDGAHREWIVAREAGDGSLMTGTMSRFGWSDIGRLSIVVPTGAEGA